MKVNNILYFSKLENRFIKDWLKIGTFSGIQIFLDNFIYAVMVCKMVNAVSESGNYWIANNFIYGWLLVPVTCLCEIIKKNNYKKLTFQNTWKYMCIIFGFWIISSPFWSFFIKDVLKQDSKTILSILCILVPFYIFYTIAIFIDSYFISKGKTIYNTISSLIINIVYYGIVYILFKLNIFQLNIKFIIFMFGFGMLVHCMLSIGLYKHEQKK